MESQERRESENNRARDLVRKAEKGPVKRPEKESKARKDEKSRGRERVGWEWEPMQMWFLLSFPLIASGPRSKNGRYYSMLYFLTVWLAWKIGVQQFRGFDAGKMHRAMKKKLSNEPKNKNWRKTSALDSASEEIVKCKENWKWLFGKSRGVQFPAFPVPAATDSSNFRSGRKWILEWRRSPLQWRVPEKSFVPSTCFHPGAKKRWGWKSFILFPEWKMLRREMRRDTRKVLRKELKKNVAIWQIKFRAILLNVPFCWPARSELLNSN